MTKLVSPSFPLGIPPLRSESQARLGILPKTEYRRGDYFYARQSKPGEWEKSKPPIRSLWGPVDWCGFFFGFGLGIFGFFLVLDGLI